MRDEWFIRGSVPMTKSEVRAVALSKLELMEGAVMVDVGAGTGSVSIEAAMFCPTAAVWAIEKNPEAISLLRENIKKSGTGKIHLLAGEALSLLKEKKVRESLTAGKVSGDGGISHAFIGGTSGNMKEIVEELLCLNPQIRIVLNVIALESVASVLSMLQELSIEAEIVSVQIARAKRAGNYHLMQGQNPVYIISFGGKDGEEK